MAWWAWAGFGLVLWCCVAIALAPVVGQLLKWAAAEPGGHRADPAGLTPDVYEATVPRVEVEGEPPWATGLVRGQDDPLYVEGLYRISANLRDRYGDEGDAFAGLPEWARPEADRVTLYGGVSGSLGSDFGGWSGEDDGWLAGGDGRLLAALHDAPTVLDDLESSGLPGQQAPEGIPGSADGPRNMGATGAGDESEGSGLTAPPAPQPTFPDETGRDGQLLVWRGDGFAWEDPPAPTRLLRTTGELLRADLLADVLAFMARQDAEVQAWMAERWMAV